MSYVRETFSAKYKPSGMSPRPSLKNCLFAVLLPCIFWLGRKKNFFLHICFSYIAAQWENRDFLMKMGQKKIFFFQKCQKKFGVGGLKVGR